MKKTFATIDGNEAVARVAYRLNEVIAIYPITPSSSMGEWADTWSSEERPNVWGTVPRVAAMQSEGGAAAAVHGALQTGSLTTTFTSSQGLLLMIPNLYKIAGELTSAVIHVAARSLATHALSIFGDHSDVMAARATGFALLCSASVQESQDFALIAQAATLQARVSFMHFFDGFRTSHEIQKVQLLEDSDLQALIDEELVFAHRDRALTPDHPVLRGTAQNPDVYFQSRESINPYYNVCPDIVQQAMDKFGELTGRYYRIFEYHGAPDAEEVIVIMGSGCETVHETVDNLITRGKKVGVVKVRLFRPFDVKRFVEVLPASVKAIAVLDRTKEPGSAGEPLYLDVVTAIHEEWLDRERGSGRLSTPRIIGGRYGLSSKEFTPAMVQAVFESLTQAKPKNHFTIGINDDVSHTSLTFDADFSIEPDNVVRAMFYGLGSDGTVGANKNSIKIIGEQTDNYAQGYFVYDSKKSGSMTVSHLRFGPQPIRSTYLIDKANFIGCHQWTFLERIDVLKAAVVGGTFLLNSPYDADTVWEHLPVEVQQQITRKQLKFYIIDANQVARESGMGGRINTIMQVCFFALAGVLPQEEAIAKIKQAIEKTYGKKGAEVVRMNLEAVDRTLENLHKVEVEIKQMTSSSPPSPSSPLPPPPPPSPPSPPSPYPSLPVSPPEFMREVLGKIMAWQGDELPVSAFPVDGTFPTGTAKWEKRNVAEEIPVWDPDVCVQCSKCVIVCPHGVIRGKAYEAGELANAPITFKSINAKDKDFAKQKFTIQVAPEDCTGCGICVDVCPAKNKSLPERKAIYMEPQLPLREQERENWNFFLSLPNPDRRQLKLHQIRQQQLQEPLFEFSGACAGCGETPYLKLLTQLFGDRAVIANATGCSSIYGGNLPTTPWTTNAEGKGPAWSNGLFEDNAEFGFGFRLSLDKHAEFAAELLQKLSDKIGDDNLVQSILKQEQKTEADIYEQREHVKLLKQKLDQLLESEQNAKTQEQQNAESFALENFNSEIVTTNVSGYTQIKQTNVSVPFSSPVADATRTEHITANGKPSGFGGNSFGDALATQSTGNGSTAVSPALREGFQRQIPSEGDPPAVLAPPQVTGEPVRVDGSPGIKQVASKTATPSPQHSSAVKTADIHEHTQNQKINVSVPFSSVVADATRTERLTATPSPQRPSAVQNLKSIADYLVRKSVWIVGGDGWAYDIDFGGIDHVLASGRNVNILVMDTEVYSNTGGQSSKATPRAAVAKFAASGKPAGKKDLGLIAMTYGNIYVASVALGARDEHTLKAFLEAEAYDGPSLIIAYSHCIAHGINMTTAMNHQKALVEAGRWLLYRYNPDLRKQGKNPLQLDMRQPKQSVEQSMYQENRFKMLTKSKPALAKRLLEEAQAEVDARWQMYEYLANRKLP